MENVNCFTYNKKFADKISNLCIEKYNKLPKTGKPNINQSQWTLLSGICVEINNKLKVITLGTGTKCLGVTSYSKNGDVLHDSHAEVLARRAFLRYLYSQMNISLTSNNSEIFEIIDIKNKKFALKPNIKFHFYTSHTPCGDASIFPRKIKRKTLNKIQNQSKLMKLEKDFLKKRKLQKDINGEEIKIIPQTLNPIDKSKVKTPVDILKITFTLDASIPTSETLKPAHKSDCTNLPQTTDTIVSNCETSSSEEEDDRSGDIGSMVDDYHRTGARCLPDELNQDPKTSSEYHVTGLVRTKPGRGDPTFSMSCSDKIAKWNVVGWQGALLSNLLETPLVMSTITVGGGIAFCMNALERAVLTRVASIIPKPPPVLLHADVAFKSGKRMVKRYLKQMGKLISSAHPVPSSVIWCDVKDKPHEISIEGIRQGTSRKNHNLDNSKSILLISTYKLLIQFIKLSQRKDYINISYEKIKFLSINYQNKWKICKKILGNWAEVPKEFKQFSIKNIDEIL